LLLFGWNLNRYLGSANHAVAKLVARFNNITDDHLGNAWGWQLNQCVMEFGVEALTLGTKLLQAKLVAGGSELVGNRCKRRAL
jgi:hypothetical protein